MTSPTPRRFSNYVRTHRRRLGLSQDDLAFLLGKSFSEHISRYEHFCRVPTLENALALAIILRVSPVELFAREYERIRERVQRQASRLATRISADRADAKKVRKVAFLKTLGLSADNT
jgi:transcriptional regulator with XRE-family HTH domain